MPKVPVYNISGEKTGEVELAPAIFEVKPDAGVIQQVVVAELANTRNTVAHTKTKGEVRGGGKKPWKQKGTGRARAGSIRSPLWKGGGITFGPRSSRNYSKKVNRSQFRKSLFMTLSGKLADKNLIILENFPLEKISTKAANTILKELRAKLKISNSENIILAKPDKLVERSLRNLPGTKPLGVNEMSPYRLLKQPVTIILKDALPVIEKTFLK